MQDFIYYNKNGLDFPVSEKIQVTTSLDGLDSQTFLISNTKDVKSEFVANEIDFYIKNSQDNLPNKISNVLKLYEINGVKFDFAQDIPQNGKISNSLMIIYENLDDYNNFVKNLNKDEFELYRVEEKLIKDDIGCNSVYAPYAFIDAENTITAVARMVTDFIIKKGDFLDQAWTMFGDLELNQHLINPKINMNDSYSILKRDFDGNKL